MTINNKSFRKNDHAIVLGASISGLLTARVLSDFFKKVTVVERDELPTDNRIRNGVPQARHLHALLAKGEEVITELFPGIDQRFDELGAAPFDVAEQSLFIIGGEALRPYTCGVSTRTLRRSTLEAEVRARVKQIDNVVFRERTDVTGLVGNGDQTAVAGVALRSRDGAKAQETLLADFVVDATGRRSKATKWLEAMGYEAPETTIIDATVGYATRAFQPHAGFDVSWRFAAAVAEPPFKTRGGGMMVQEDGTIIMTLLGTAGDIPPLGEDEFVAFADDVHPEFIEVLENCDPISPISGYRKLENQWRHYEDLDRMPERFTVVGDSFCAFNPIYGQGMTAAALEIRKLGELLQRANGRLDGVGKKLIKAMPKIVFPAWMLAAGEDLRWPTTAGEPRSMMIHLSPWLSEKIQAAMPHSIEVSQAFIEVQNLIKPPSRFFRPWTFALILWHSGRGKKQSKAASVVDGHRAVQIA